MVYKHCVNYDGDEDCHKCCSPNHDKYIWGCPADCPDYRDCFGHGLDEQDGDGDGTAIERMRKRRWGDAPTIIPADEPFGKSEQLNV